MGLVAVTLEQHSKDTGIHTHTHTHSHAHGVHLHVPGLGPSIDAGAQGERIILCNSRVLRPLKVAGKCKRRPVPAVGQV